MNRILDPHHILCGACLALAASFMQGPAAGRLNAEALPPAGPPACQTAAPIECPKLFAEAARSERDGQFARARALYEEICRQSPHHGDAWHRLAVVSVRLGHKDRGVECFETALELERDDAELLNDYGFALFLNNDLQRAEELLRRSLALHPDNPRAVNNLAIVVGARGRDDECLELFQQVASGAALERNLAFVRTLRSVRSAGGLPEACPEVSPKTGPSQKAVSLAEAAPAPFIIVPSRPAQVPDTEQGLHPEDHLAARISALQNAAVARLTDADPQARCQALVELADLRGHARPAIENIEPLLADADPAVRAEAARSLWLIDSRSDASVPALVELLSSEDASVRVVAAFTLGTMGSAAGRSLPVLEGMMRKRTGVERVHAAEAVLRISREHSDAIAVLTAAAHDADPEIRFAAVYALGAVALGHDTHDHQVLGALRTAAAQDPDPRIREAAALNLDVCRSATTDAEIQPTGSERPQG